jgi:hypothetical protein
MNNTDKRNVAIRTGDNAVSEVHHSTFTYRHLQITRGKGPLQLTGHKILMLASYQLYLIPDKVIPYSKHRNAIIHSIGSQPEAR